MHDEPFERGAYEAVQAVFPPLHFPPSPRVACEAVVFRDGAGDQEEDDHRRRPGRVGRDDARGRAPHRAGLTQNGRHGGQGDRQGGRGEQGRAGARDVRRADRHPGGDARHGTGLRRQPHEADPERDGQAEMFQRHRFEEERHRGQGAEQDADGDAGRVALRKGLAQAEQGAEPEIGQHFGVAEDGEIATVHGRGNERHRAKIRTSGDQHGRGRPLRERDAQATVALLPPCLGHECEGREQKQQRDAGPDQQRLQRMAQVERDTKIEQHGKGSRTGRTPHGATRALP